MGSITTAPARHMVSTAERLAIVAAAMKKLGAATVPDLAAETGYNRETCRRYLNLLIERGAALLVSAGSTHISSIYGPTEISGEIEFDVRRISTANWPRGQGRRDPLVAALFGTPSKPDEQSLKGNGPFLGCGKCTVTCGVAIICVDPLGNSTSAQRPSDDFQLPLELSGSLKATCGDISTFQKNNFSDFVHCSSVEKKEILA